MQPQWTETDILIACALRFDGYRYVEAHAFDHQAALTQYMATGSWAQLNEWEQLATFFLLQRYLFKWGGEYLAEVSPEWRGFRELFFLNCGREIPAAYRMNDYVEHWEAEYRPQLEVCIQTVRQAHEATQYADRATLRPGLR